MKLLYVAGPYTAPTAAGRAANIQRAREVGDQINRIGGGRCLAVVPHFLGSGIEDSLSDEQWYEATLEVMRRCDAVVLTEDWQRSLGALGEREEAERQGLPVFEERDLFGRGVDAFGRWLRGEPAPRPAILSQGTAHDGGPALETTTSARGDDEP